MRLHLLLAALALLLTLAPAGANPLVGTWVHDNPAAAERIVCVFNADGSGSIDGDPIRYSLSPDRSTLHVTLDGERLTYTLRINGDTLTARGGDFEGTLTFQRTPPRAPRAAPPTPEPLPPVPPAPVPPAQATPAPVSPAPVSPAPVPHAPVPHAPSTPAQATPAPGPAAAPTALAPATRPASRPTLNPIVGTWTDGQGRIRFNPDGSCDYLGQQLTYTYDGTTLTLKGPASTVEIPVTIDRDTFTARAQGQVQTLTRVPEPAPGNAANHVPNPNSPAGVYVVSESSIDPSNAIVITQYLTLWPDGSVSWAKSELGASRTAVSEQLERFSAFRNGGDKGQVLGQWQSTPDGRSLVIQWNVWNNLRCQALFDPASGTLRVERMGILQDSATLDYKRQ